nr:uncharacterized protein LOC112428582 [Macaca nemestrina]
MTKPALLHCHFFTVSDAGRQIDVSEGARTDIPYQFAFPSDNESCLRAAAASRPERRRWRLGQAYRGRRQEAEQGGLSWRPGPRCRRREPDACCSVTFFFVFRLVVCQAAVCEGLLAVQTGLGHLFLGSRCCLAFAATSGLEKGRGELGRGTAATTAAGSGPVTPPTTPSGYSSSNQHKMPPEPGSRFFTAQSTLGKGYPVPAPKDPPHRLRI